MTGSESKYYIQSGKDRMYYIPKKVSTVDVEITRSESWISNTKVPSLGD